MSAVLNYFSKNKIHKNNNKNKRLFFSLFLLCLYLYFAYHTAHATENKLFERSNTPPPGFENLDPNAPETTLVSVFYGRKLILNTLATFTPKHIQFLNPSEIIQSFSGFETDKIPEITTALSGELSNHTENLCPKNKAKICQPLTPKIAGVVFDPNSYKAYLFLNPDIVQISKIKNAQLPDSTADFSVLSDNSVIFTRNNFDSYALNTRTLMGERNYYFNSRIYYTHQDLNTPDLLSMPELAGYYYHQGDRYSLGVLPSGGSGLFTQTITMIGAKFENQMGPQSFPISAQGSPVIIYLPLPAQVQIYKNNDLIYANDLPAGKHEIDTTNFPIGSYDIHIKITDALQQTREEDQFFVKRTSGLSDTHARYRIAFGMIERDDTSLDRNTSLNTQLPEFSNQPIISLDRDQALGQNSLWEWDESIISNISRSFFDSELIYTQTYGQLSPGVLLSTSGQYGLGGTLNFHLNQFSTSITATRLYGTVHILSNASNNTFLPVSFSKYLISQNLQFAYHQERFSIFNTWQKSLTDDSYSQTSSFTWTHPLIQAKSALTQLSLNASHTLHNAEISLGIECSFLTQYFSGRALLAYEINRLEITSNSNSNSNLNTTTEQGLMKQIALRKDIPISDTAHLITTIDGSDNAYAENYSGKLDYIALPLRARASYLHTLLHLNHDTQDLYSAQIDSSLAYSDGHWGVGYPNGKDAGIIVEINSPDPGETQVKANQKTVAIVDNNWPTPIFLAPYQTYQLTINPESSATQYNYDALPKNITLYRGNFQFISWKLTRDVILFAQILNAENNPMPHLLLQNHHDLTDDEGYLQAEIPEAQRKLTLITLSGQKCTVSIPNDIHADNGLLILKKPLLCHVS